MSNEPPISEAEANHLCIRLAELVELHDIESFSKITVAMDDEEKACVIFALARSLALSFQAMLPGQVEQRYEALYAMAPPA